MEQAKPSSCHPFPNFGSCVLFGSLASDGQKAGRILVSRQHRGKVCPHSPCELRLKQAPNPNLYSNPMLAGNVVALLSPLIFVPVLTYAFGPQNYDYKSMAAIRLGNDEDIAEENHTDLELVPGAATVSAERKDTEQKKLYRASLIAKTLTGFMTLCLLILWPMPMYGSGYVFSKKVCQLSLLIHWRNANSTDYRRKVLHGLGCCRYLVAVLQFFLCRTVPTVGG